MDSEDYQKAAPDVYMQLAPALAEANFDAVSVEDAHRHNDLKLFECFKNITVILGVIDIAQSRIESVEEITTRLQAVLGHIDDRRLMVAPDCGLGFLSREMVVAKITNMVKAAKSV